jgi:APA family basic amino acid/polyamine antiporter
MSLFVLRKREPGAPRPFKAMGYPVAPAIFVIACLLIVVNAIYSRPGPTGAGLIVMGAGIPLYMWLTRRRR